MVTVFAFPHVWTAEETYEKKNLGGWPYHVLYHDT